MSAADEPPPVPLPLVDALLELVAGVIHDRPVQGLVAGALLVESSGGDDPLLGRAAQALARAGTQAREIMWALSRPSLRADHLTEDLEELFGRVADPDTGLRVTVDVGGAASWDRLARLCAAAHDVLAAAVLRGGMAREVELIGAEGDLRALVTTAGHPRLGEEDPWLVLARARLDGGRVFVLPGEGDDDVMVHTTALSTAG